MGLADALSSTGQQAIGEAAREGLRRVADGCLRNGGLPLKIVLPDRSQIDFGGPARVTLRINDMALLAELATPSLGVLGAAYVSGRLDIEGDLLEALPLGEGLVAAGGSTVTQRLVQAWRRHRRGEDRSAIQHHYDVGNDFYALWLDAQMVYSCAYFRVGDETIDAAQMAKLDHICRKLRLAPGERFLDVGCGWGALIMHAARHYGARAVQATHARAAVASASRTASTCSWSTIATCRSALVPMPSTRWRASACSSTWACATCPSTSAPSPVCCATEASSSITGTTSVVIVDRGRWAAASANSSTSTCSRIGELPHMYVAAREMSAAGFEVADVESLRPHYATTLAHWYRRPQARMPRRPGWSATRRCGPGSSTWPAVRGWLRSRLGQHLPVARFRAPARAGPDAVSPLTREWMYQRGETGCPLSRVSPC